MPRSMISASSSGSMLPPDSTSPTLRPAKRVRLFQQGREPGRARALGDRLLDLEQQQDRLLDVALVDQHHLVDAARAGSAASACRAT